MDLYQPRSTGFIQRRTAHLFEELLDHRADTHDLRGLLDEIGQRRLAVPAATGLRWDCTDRLTVGTNHDDRGLCVIGRCRWAHAAWVSHSNILTENPLDVSFGAGQAVSMPMFSALEGLLPDVEARAVTMADVPVLTDLVHRISIDATGTTDTSEDEMRDELVGPRFDIERDTLLILDSRGRALVYGQAYDEHDDRGYVDVYVDPVFDDATFAQVAERAVKATLDRLAEAVRERSGTGTVAAAGLYRGEDRMLAAYKAQGFESSTTYWRMSIDIGEKDTFAAVIPNNVEIKAVNPDDDEVMALAVELTNDTFSGHHGHVELNLENYIKSWRGTAKYDPKAWWFAFDSGEPVGLCIGDEAKLDENIGYVPWLGVKKSARGKGIARALLLTAFDEYARRGRTKVQLGVDTANDTGATRLYESVGMHSVMTFDTLEQQISLS